MGTHKICLICRQPCLLNFSVIFQKGADGISQVSRLKKCSFTVTTGMYIHFSCTLVPSSSKEIFDRKTRTVFAMVVLLYREKQTSKS